MDRSAPQGLVQQVADEIVNARGPIRLVIPPEGTRSKVEYWKSGFYRIALAANVPILVADLDFTQKYVGFGTAVYPTGDVRKDMEAIRALALRNVGKNPALAGYPRLKDEDEAA